MKQHVDAASFDCSILRELNRCFKHASEDPLQALALYEASLAGGEIPLRGLSSALGLTPVQASRLVNRMEDAGKVVRVAGDDRRTLLVCVDEGGWDSLERLAAAFGGDDGLADGMLRARALSSAVREAKARYRISTTQAVCLLALNSLGTGSVDPSSSFRVAQACGIPRTSAYCAIRALKAKGL